MNYSQIEEILATSSPDDWIYDDSCQTYTYKHDVDLHIEINHTDESYIADWAQKHADSNAKKVEYIIKYGCSFIKRYYFVALDGHRVYLPYPKNDDNLCVTQHELTFAYMINRGYKNVDDYIQRCKFKITDD